MKESLAGLCFDTTSSNTGIHTGAITVVQQADKRLLVLACRHHMLEIVATAVFDFFLSTGPQIALFRQLKDQWYFIDQKDYAVLDHETDGYSLTLAESQ